MTTYETYGEKYQKGKQTRINNSKSASKITLLPSFSPIKDGQQPNQLGNVVGKLSDRVDSLQIKIVSMTNIIKLLQKYTESRDEQYEKQKQNEQFYQRLQEKMTPTQVPELQSKVQEFEMLSQRMKSEITAMQSLRMAVSRQNLKRSPKMDQSNSQQTFSSPAAQRELIAEVQTMVNMLESSLREELNKKIQICMNYFKTLKMPSTFSTANVNEVMVEEQLHSITLNINKIQNDCARNKMILDSKIQELAKYVTQIKQMRSRSVSVRRKSEHGHVNEDSISIKSEVSKKSRSKVKSRGKEKGDYNEELRVRISEQKKIKENELKEALRKKKENQQKLKMKK